MLTFSNLAVYQQVAQQWSTPTPDTTPANFDQLPFLTPAELQQLLAQVANEAYISPKTCFAILALVIARQTPLADPLLEAQLYWWAGYTAQQWLQPFLADFFLQKAQPLFEQMGAAEWTAAGLWQQNAHPWTRPHYTQAFHEVEQAYTHLATHPQWALPCQFTLVYAAVTAGQWSAAEQHLLHAEPLALASPNPLHQALWLFTQAVWHRRYDRFEEAITSFNQALTLFVTCQAQVYQARTLYFLGYCLWSGRAEAEQAEQHWQQALQLCHTADLPLLQAMIYNGLGELYNNTGRYTPAAEWLNQAEPLWQQFPLPSFQANFLLEKGTLNLFLGQYETAEAYFSAAVPLYQQLHLTGMAAIAHMYQGESYRRAGSYQRALHFLELAHQQFKTVQNGWRTAECELRLAAVWLSLGQYTTAQTYLTAAQTFFTTASHPTFLSTIYYYHAETELKQGQTSSAIVWLEKNQALLHSNNHQASLAFTHKLRAELHLLLQEYTQAAHWLTKAEQFFADTNRPVEQADCRLLWGRYYSQQQQWSEAEEAYHQAITLNQDDVPHLSWQAYAGLATAAQATGRPAEALTHYHHLVRSLGQMRRSLWQPALLDSYLHQPATALDAAVLLAVKLEDTLSTTIFIEENKAQLLNQQLHYQPQNQLSSTTLPPQLQTLSAEIRWLQDQLRQKAELPTRRLFNRPDQQLRQQLKQKKLAYDVAYNEWERSLGLPPTAGQLTFDLAHFQQTASQKWGNQWGAIDYYLTPQLLCGLFITPAGVQSWCAPLPPAVQRILHLLQTSSANHLPPADLATLGEWLFPPLVQQHLSPETYLVIAPHRLLHRLPWPILELHNAPLVTHCLPAVVPSLQSLQGLWRTPAALPTQAGLLLTVSNFNQRWPALPQVEQEVQALAPHVALAWHNEQATWSALQQLQQTAGLTQFAFLHLASHAFADTASGRVAGLALYDQDVWLNEWQQCAPLPALVTLSACSGTQSKLYEGDEQASLAISCLTAGAKTVIGSLWPVLDQTAAELMPHFYTHLPHHSPAQALALAQRTMWHNQHPPSEWGGFLSIGHP